MRNVSTEVAFDGGPANFWSAPVGSRQAVLEADFTKPVRFDRSLIREWLNDGQRLKRYRMEAWDAEDWKGLVEGRAIGHKRIDSFAR